MKPITQYKIVLAQIVLLCCFCNLTLFSQSTSEDIYEVTDTSKKKRINIINTDVFEFITTDTNTLRKFTGNVLFNHKGTDFYCDKAMQFMETEIVVASGNVHIQKPDSFDIWSDYLVYYSKEKLAKFRSNVIFQDSSARLLTDSLDYDMNTDIGDFWGGGTFITDSSTLASDRGVYYQRKDEAFFYDNVHLSNPDFDLYSDSMRYDTEEQIAYFIAATKIVNGEDVIYCNSGFYDTKTNKAQFGGNTQMKSGATKISANELVYDKDIGYGEATGNVIWEDTTEEITILANYTEYEDSLSYVMATDDPLLIDVTDGDTLYLSADTLITYKLPYPEKTDTVIYTTDTLYNDTTITSLGDSISPTPVIVRDSIVVMDTTEHDSIRIFNAYKNTKILSGRMSGICDSLYFSTGDSIFRMNQNPIVWIDTTQFTGDSIHLVLKNKVLHRIFIYRNAMIIHENVKSIYDQTKGKLVEGFFKDDHLTKMEIKGNGESIYFIQDDSLAFVGGNKSICSKMVIKMKQGENEVDYITFITKPEATFTPFRMINLSTYRLEGFSWQFERKPLNVYDIVRYKPLYEYYLQYKGEVVIEPAIEEIENDTIKESSPPEIIEIREKSFKKNKKGQGVKILGDE